MTKLFLTVDRLFWYLIALVFCLILILNQNSNLMGGLLGYYLDFKNIILSNFDAEVAKHGRPTFPMWGYGWIFLLTENKYFIFIAQGVVAFAALGFSFSYLSKYQSLQSSSHLLLKMLLLVSFSWIAVHFALTPYSLSISLMIIALVLFCIGLAQNNRRSFVLVFFAGLIAGLILNFRSDYLYFFALMPLLLFLVQKDLTQAVSKSFLWFLAIGLMIMPWMFYTNSVIGKPTLTSTNSGHVLYIGLGQLPNNKWGITPADGDPKMREELIANLSIEADSLTYQGNRYLKARFLEIVKEDPSEYFKKVAHSSARTIISGIYVPEFYNLRKNCIQQSAGGGGQTAGGLVELPAPCRPEFLYDISTRPIASLFDDTSKSFTYLFMYFSIAIGVLLLFVAFLATPVAVFLALKTRNVFLFVSSMVFIYQFLINAFAYQMKIYSTFSYFFGLIMIIFVFDFYQKRKSNLS